MSQNRRDFLKASSMIAWGATTPLFMARTAAAAPTSDQAGSKDSILVVIELTGGNDGLNTVIPFKDPEYAKLRPTLKQNPRQILKINEEIGLHPAMTGLAELNEAGNLCIVQGVGYPNPTQSHFRSMDIWQAARRKNFNEGWLGRALKQLPPTPAFHLKTNNEPSPLALDGSPVRSPSINTLEEFQLQVSGSSGKDQMEQRKLIESTVAEKKRDKKSDLLNFVQRTASNTYASSRRLQEVGNNYQPKVPYPNTGLANRLKLAAQLIDANLGARLFYVRLGGFDTHASQAAAHTSLLTQLSGAMTAFYKDMKARGHGDRVMMMTFSEFGRRPYENGSKGTDHGTSAPMLFVGNRIKSGLIGEHPSLTDLAFRNMKHHTDFHQVYAAVLENWVGVSSKKVLDGDHKPVDIFKA